MRVVSNGSQEMPIFRLGAFIYKPDCTFRCWDRRPVMAKIRAPTLHLAQRIFGADIRVRL
jgi:hypothetical protein